jgi:peptide/nickel transport system permease protein
MPRMAARFVRSRRATLGVLVLLLIGLLTLGAPFLLDRSPDAQDARNARLAPFSAEALAAGYPLGTDNLGRDMLARLLYGGRISLLVGIAGVLVAGLIGVSIGLIAGYCGGWIENLLMRIADVQLAIPTMLLALALMAILGPSLPNVIGVMAATSWIIYARTIRAVTLSLKEMQYVEAARAGGYSDLRIVVRHILPNTLTPIIVIATQQAAQLILLESSLSYLGVGIPPDIPTWGRMIAEGRNYLTSASWLVTLPGLALMATVLALNFFGDGLRDVLDPRLRI